MIFFGYKLCRSVNCLQLILILFETLIGHVNCYLKIDHSSIWVPIFQSSTARALFMVDDEFNFLLTDHSSTVINRDPGIVGRPEGLGQDFGIAYPICSNSSVCALFNRNHRSSEFYRIDKSELRAIAFSSQFYNTRHLLTGQTRTVPTNIYPQFMSTFQVVPFDGTFAHEEGFVLFLEWDPVSVRLMVNQIDWSIRSINNIFNFFHGGKTYWIGYQEVTDREPTYTFGELNFLGENLPRYVYKELYSTTFRSIYGHIRNVRFVQSNRFDKSDPLFSKLLLVHCRKENEQDSIVSFSFHEMLNAYAEMNGENCETTAELWPVLRYDEGHSCFSTTRTNASLELKKWPFEGIVLENILSPEWGILVDFVPLSLEASPGYIFLVLSTDTTRYRYSIHHMTSSGSIITHPRSTIFDYAEAPSDLTKIFYYANPIPQVLLTINGYHYSEVLVLCPLLQSSCLDCISTKVHDNVALAFQKFCSWYPSGTGDDGVCSDDNSSAPIPTLPILPPSFSTNYLANPCFRFSIVETTYSDDELTFSIDFTLNGYHSDLQNIFPITIYLINSTVDFQCSVEKIVDSSISIICNGITRGEYQLVVTVKRISYPYMSFSSSPDLLSVSSIISTEAPLEAKAGASFFFKIIFPFLAMLIALVAAVGIFTASQKSKESSSSLKSQGSQNKIASIKSWASLKSQAKSVPSVKALGLTPKGSKDQGPKKSRPPSPGSPSSQFDNLKSKSVIASTFASKANTGHKGSHHKSKKSTKTSQKDPNVMKKTSPFK